MTEVTEEDEKVCVQIVNTVLADLEGHKFRLAVCALAYTIKRLCQQDEIAGNAAVIAWVMSLLDDTKGELMEDMPTKGEAKEWLN